MEVLKIVQEHLPKDQPAKVTKISLKVGKLTAIVPDSFKFCMEIISKDTPAEDAQILIEEVPLTVECQDCKTVSDLEEPVFICPNCGGNNLALISGRELFVESIEVEEGKGD